MKTDSQLQQDVMAELAWEPAVHAAQIGVEVKHGVVTLSGEVSSYVGKLSAESAAQRVPGVRALAVSLQVKLSALGQRTDADIAASARQVMGWNSALTADAVQVMVERGWLTLSGQVQWQYQRQAAADSVRHLQGVTGVSNQIAIQPGLHAAAVKADITAAIRRRAARDARAVQVEVSGSEVTLSGTVNSWSEREMARRSAWASPGVHHVVDHIKIDYADLNPA